MKEKSWRKRRKRDVRPGGLEVFDGCMNTAHPILCANAKFSTKAKSKFYAEAEFLTKGKFMRKENFIQK